MIIVSKVSSEEELKQVFTIRNKVFVEEQNCPPELEWEYEDISIHFLAIYNGIPAGASRWRKTNEGYKLERFAVLKEFRRKGVGQELVKKTLEDLPKDANKVYLNAQITVVKLYEKFNFIAIGDIFEEAGIQHYKMILKSNTYKI
jgi:predicted GNAT family N-acyltransferase